MGMSTHVIGFKPPDEEWDKMRAVYDACTAAKIEVPARVERFFEDGAPDPHGVEVHLRNHECVREWKDGRALAVGYEIEIAKVPKDIKIIRIYNSW